MLLDLTIEPSGSEDFDRARRLLADAREDEALDWFEVASGTASQPEVRASAAAHVAAILLSRGRPWEVAAWAETARSNVNHHGIADVLEASARIQLEDLDGARELLDGVQDTTDEWFACSPVVVRVLHAHLEYVDGRREAARDEVLAAFAEEPFAADVWDAFARFCAETDFDVAPVVAAVTEERVLGVLGALQGAEPEGVDRIVDRLWERRPKDPRVLAAATRFAPALAAPRALEWSARLRAAGENARCPLIARAKDTNVEPSERLRAAAVAFATFADERARDAVEAAVVAVPDSELQDVLDEMRVLAPELSDSVVVAGASTTPRTLRLSTALWRGDAHDEAYAVLVHGLSREDAEHLDTETFAALVPSPVLEALADHAANRGDAEVATILWSVSAWADQSDGSDESDGSDGSD
ncbi:MAG: hypothetical protein JWL83_179 [Actinomycetia bacterium]|nr:hypothetical protein [Actinomycetes bacterium]